MGSNPTRPTTIFYAYSGTETLAEHASGGADTDYVYAGEMRIAKTGSSVSRYFYITDALGSTRLVTDTTGKVVFYDNYQPWGTDNTSKGSETYTFTGKPVSQTTGLYYEYQRWYDPSVGRFISLDPLAGYLSDPQSLNGYVYVQDSPTTYTDPSGMIFERHVSSGNGCHSSMLDSAFWKDPLGGILCSFGYGPAGTTTGASDLGGAGASAAGAGPIGAVVFGIGTIVWVADNWSTISTDWNDFWGTSQTGRAGTDNGGGGSNGGGITITPGITGVTGITTILPSVGGVTPSVGTPFIDMGRGPRPRQPPRTPGEDPSYLREKFTQKETPGGAGLPWAGICTAATIGGVLTGFVVRAETSDSGLNYPVEGGVGGLGLCALAYIKWH